MAKFRDGRSFDWDDLGQLVRRDLVIDPAEITAPVVAVNVVDMTVVPLIDTVIIMSACDPTTSVDVQKSSTWIYDRSAKGLSRSFPVRSNDFARRIPPSPPYFIIN
jgi:hypothetical protein